MQFPEGLENTPFTFERNPNFCFELLLQLFSPLCIVKQRDDSIDQLGMHVQGLGGQSANYYLTTQICYEFTYHICSWEF